MISILFFTPNYAVEVVAGRFRYSGSNIVTFEGRDGLWNHESDCHFSTGVMLSQYDKWIPKMFDVFVVRQGCLVRTGAILFHELFHVVIRLVYGPYLTGDRVNKCFDELSNLFRLFWLTYLPTTKNRRPLAYCERAGCEDFS